MDQSNQYLPAITQLVTVAVAAYFAYLFGSLKSKNEILSKRRIEVAEKLGDLIQIIIENNVRSLWFYENEFGLDSNFHESMGRLERQENLYMPEIQRIVDGETSISSAHENLRIARLYIDQKVLDPITEYLELQKFTFTTGVLGDLDYLEKYFENLLNPENRVLSGKLEDSILKQLRKLAN